VFRRPQTWTPNIHVCVGTSFIGWFDDKLTLTHDLSLPDTPNSKQYGQAPHSSTMGFSMVASKPRPAMCLEGLKHGPLTFIFVLEQVLLGGLMAN
jgi:hypothetical protein